MTHIHHLSLDHDSLQILLAPETETCLREPSGFVANIHQMEKALKTREMQAQCAGVSPSIIARTTAPTNVARMMIG